MHLPSGDAIAVLHNSRALFNAQGGCDVWIVPFLILRHRLCNRSFFYKTTGAIGEKTTFTPLLTLRLSFGDRKVSVRN